MKKIMMGSGSLALLLALFLLVQTGTSQAREKNWFIGLGGTQASANTSLNSSDSVVYLDSNYNLRTVNGVDLESDGDGYVFQVGWAASRFLALELMMNSTGHEATNPIVYPGETLDARLETLLFGVRGMVPFGSSFEIFARFGLGIYSLSVTQNVDGPFGTRDDSVFSGEGSAFGGGVAFNIGIIGIEMSVTRHKATLDTIEFDNNYGDFPSRDLNVTHANLIISIHFGREMQAGG